MKKILVAIMGHDETKDWLETHDWNVTIDEL